jgi:hypothetical protein
MGIRYASLSKHKQTEHSAMEHRWTAPTVHQTQTCTARMTRCCVHQSNQRIMGERGGLQNLWYNIQEGETTSTRHGHTSRTFVPPAEKYGCQNQAVPASSAEAMRINIHQLCCVMQGVAVYTVAYDTLRSCKC